jgi:hypothetical protein
LSVASSAAATSSASDAWRAGRAHVGAAFNELMYVAREMALRSEEETRTADDDLLMRSRVVDERYGRSR